MTAVAKPGARHPTNRLPERVRTMIRAEQDRSEILIGWVQLAGVILFAVVYALAPKTFDADVMFAPVPWALGAYFAFTLVRLGLAYRHGLPGWMIVASVIVDMTVLMVTIWSFHLQYGQPPGFSLKAPTMLYVFILIALRSLRFEARYVVLAGAAAVFGWIVLLVYALEATPGDQDLTRDYVEYITSAKILIGGEVDKLLSITLVTAILALALARAHRLLVRAATEQAAAHDLSRFFAPEVAQAIVASEQGIRPGEGRLRNAAILFVDIRGFTPLAHSLPADDVMALLAEYQGRTVPVIEAHGGRVDKFLGDGIMATFGAALESETYAADALRTVRAIAETIDRWNVERGPGRAIAIGMGAAAGPVVFGAVGDASRLEFTVVGDAVNLAAKLEKHCKHEHVRGLVPLASLAVARDQGFTAAGIEVRRGREVEGLAEPLDLAVLVPWGFAQR